MNGGCVPEKRLNPAAGKSYKRNITIQAREFVVFIMIMIITPDEVFRSAMVLHFREKDYALSIPEHRQEVTSLVEKHAPEVIVLDISIADPNGPTVLKDLRATGYGGKIIVISGPSNRPLMVNMHLQKIDQVIRKTPSDSLGPFIDQLESLIRVMLREETAQKSL
ncbi:MAG: hypothetical protein NPIRA03_06280 [Nitrospirales bacterium]|nr:MAG: hypothetical protein NPIRA03_06280 [Nitrospirales bacterium]